MLQGRYKHSDYFLFLAQKKNYYRNANNNIIVRLPLF